MNASGHPHGKPAGRGQGVNAHEQFIVRLYPAARQVARKTGMSWELMLAQAAQETGWGQKILPGTHNIYNVKAFGGWKGASKTFKVWEIEKGSKVWKEQPFRVYGSYQDALEDRVAFLRGNARYRAAGLFDAGTRGDLRKEAQALQKGHYATDPHYAESLIKLFNGYTMQRALREIQ